MRRMISAARPTSRSRRLLLLLCCAGMLAGTLLLQPARDARVRAAGPAFLVKDIIPGPGDALGTHNPYPWASARGRLFFTADDGVHGEELWTSDGTAGGTTLLKDIRAEGYSSILFLTNVNNTIFFGADDGVHGYELWKSDGTPAGTSIVADIFPGKTPSFPELLTNANGMLFFRALDPTGWGLWKSDGTAGGTVAVKSHPYLVTIYDVTNVNGSIFYVSDGAQTTGFRELWHSDGTAAGTTLLKAFAAGTQQFGVLGSLSPMSNQVFFFVYTDGRGYELWKSDGTTAGTTPLSETGPRTPVPNFAMQQVGEWLFILIGENDQPATLWKTDGTASGTVRVKVFSSGTSPSFANARLMADANGKLLFVLYTADQPPGNATGSLWTSDGTSAGTVPIKDQIMPSLDMATICGKVFFGAEQHVSGSPTNINEELWQSDGTSAGTFEVQDIAPGEASSAPRSVTGDGHRLFFSADDGTSGRELWMLPISRASAPGPTPAIPLPHQVFLPHAQVDASC
jgi:ELWxxDGT repeat protein